MPGKVVGPSFSAAEVPDVIEAILDCYRHQRHERETLIQTLRRTGWNRSSRPPMRRAALPPLLPGRPILPPPETMHTPAPLSSSAHRTTSRKQPVLILNDDQDALQAGRYFGISVVELQFPAHTDGRAYSQAQLLRRRRLAGTLRATGEVLIDQLPQMQRCGFDQAVLRADQNAAHGQRLLALFAQGYYQGDALHPQPRFSGEGSDAATLPVAPAAEQRTATAPASKESTA